MANQLSISISSSQAYCSLQDPTFHVCKNKLYFLIANYCSKNNLKHLNKFANQDAGSKTIP